MVIQKVVDVVHSSGLSEESSLAEYWDDPTKSVSTLRKILRDMLTDIPGVSDEDVRPGLSLSFFGPEQQEGSFFWSSEGYIEADIVNEGGRVLVNICTLESASGLDDPVMFQSSLDEQPCFLEEAISSWRIVAEVGFDMKKSFVDEETSTTTP